MKGLVSAIKDLITGLVAVMAFIGMRATALLWGLFKVFLALFVLLGAFKELTSDFTLSNYRGMSLWSAVWAALDDLGTIVAENWTAAALIIIFVWMLSTKRTIKRLATDITHTKIAAVATLNYLDVEVETEGLKEIKDVGLFQTFENAIEANFLGAVLGMREELTDDAVTAKPVRLGRKVNLQDDIREWIHCDTKGI